MCCGPQLGPESSQHWAEISAPQAINARLVVVTAVSAASHTALPADRAGATARAVRQVGAPTYLWQITSVQNSREYLVA